MTGRQPKTQDAGHNQRDAADAGWRHWLVKEQDAKDGSADGADTGPDRIGRANRQRFHGEAQ